MRQCLSLGLSLLLCWPAAGFAARPGAGLQPEIQPVLLLKAQKKDIGMHGAASAVRKATGGRILTVKKTRSAGQSAAYQVKVLLKGGHMRVLRVDASNGTLR